MCGRRIRFGTHIAVAVVGATGVAVQVPAIVGGQRPAVGAVLEVVAPGVVRRCGTVLDQHHQGVGTGAVLQGDGVEAGSGIDDVDYTAVGPGCHHSLAVVMLDGRPVERSFNGVDSDIQRPEFCALIHHGVLWGIYAGQRVGGAYAHIVDIGGAEAKSVSCESHAHTMAAIAHEVEAVCLVVLHQPLESHHFGPCGRRSVDGVGCVAHRHHHIDYRSVVSVGRLQRAVVP